MDEQKIDRPKLNVFEGNLVEPYCITFYNGEKQLGVLDFSGPEMVFTGDVEESAKVFCDFIAQLFKGRLEQAMADERELCAKVADSISEDQWALYKGRPPYTGQELERASDYTQGKSDGAEVCAAAIRARGESK